MIFLSITHYKCQYLLVCTSYTEPTCIMAVIIIRNWWQHYCLHIDSDSWILCSVLFINVLLMCTKLRDFYSLKRIIGRILENNRKTCWELQNRIFSKILSIVASSLVVIVAVGTKIARSQVFDTFSDTHNMHGVLWIDWHSP